ncbi:MAG: excalibur calcium-binding domain-containing protein [archaeon]
MRKMIILVIIGLLIVLSLFFVVVFMQERGFSSMTSETIQGSEESFEEVEPIISLSSQCDKNIYDCYNFASQFEAQKVFEACKGSSNDVHNLDRDSDGIACEALLKYD